MRHTILLWLFTSVVRCTPSINDASLNTMVGLKKHGLVHSIQPRIQEPRISLWKVVAYRWLHTFIDDSMFSVINVFKELYKTVLLCRLQVQSPWRIWSLSYLSEEPSTWCSWRAPRCSKPSNTQWEDTARAPESSSKCPVLFSILRILGHLNLSGAEEDIISVLIRFL